MKFQSMSYSLIFFQSQQATIEDMKVELRESAVRYADREASVKKMVEEMEELHENLAELDQRFERSEEHNLQLRQDRDEFRHELEDEIKRLEEGKVGFPKHFRAHTYY